MSAIPLHSILHPKVVKARLGSEDRYGAIMELLELMVQAHDLPLRKLHEVREGVFRQERKHASGSSSGLAFPHDIVGSLEVPVAAIGLAPDGIDFGGSTPSKVVLLTLFPASSGGHHALPVLEEKLLKDSALVEDLAGCDEAGELLEKIRELA